MLLFHLAETNALFTTILFMNEKEGKFLFIEEAALHLWYKQHTTFKPCLFSGDLYM